MSCDADDVPTVGAVQTADDVSGVQCERTPLQQLQTNTLTMGRAQASLQSLKRENARLHGRIKEMQAQLKHHQELITQQTDTYSHRIETMDSNLTLHTSKLIADHDCELQKVIASLQTDHQASIDALQKKHCQELHDLEQSKYIVDVGELLCLVRNHMDEKGVATEIIKLVLDKACRGNGYHFEFDGYKNHNKHLVSRVDH